MADEDPPRAANGRAIRKFNLAVGILALAALGMAAYRALPPSQITIATGPVGGSYYEDAQIYQQALKAQGVTVHLRPVPNSIDIAREVDQKTDGIDIGFVAQSLNPQDYRHTFSLGTIEQQPLFIFAAKPLGDLPSPADLRGRRLVMPPPRSASSEAALALLAQYGVTPANTVIVHMPIARAVSELSQGHFDAGFFMLNPRDGFIKTLASDPELAILDLHDAQTISRLEPSLHAVTLLHGIFDLQNNIPPRDLHMVAADITVIAHKHAPQAIIYLLLQAMEEAHRGASLINDAGTFPNLVNIALPPDPRAVDFEKTGLPWAYQNLPRWMASLVNSYLIIGLVFVVLVELWSSVLYFMELVDFLYVHFWLRILLRIEERARHGKGLRAADLRWVDRAESALLRGDKRRHSEALIDKIRASRQ